MTRSQARQAGPDEGQHANDDQGPADDDQGQTHVEWMTPGNWLDGLTQEDIKAAQKGDKGISEKPPHNVVKPYGQEVKDMWAQWDRLWLIDGVLFRSGTPTAAGLDVPLQLVVPTSMRPAMMNELHGTKTGGHLGVNKTVASLRQKFYWGGYKDTSLNGVRSVKHVAALKMAHPGGRLH